LNLICPSLPPGFGANLEGKCLELLFGKTGGPLSPVLVSALQKNEARFGTVDKSIDRNGSDGRMKDEERIIRFVDD
jgi:hypothetical protein